MDSVMENNITANTEQEQADKNTKMDKTDPTTTGAASQTSKHVVEKQIPMNVEESLTKTASQTPATTAKSMTITTKNSTIPLASQVTVQTVNNTTPQNLPLPQRPPGRARTGSAEARPFSARGVPPGCFNSIQSVSRLSLEQGIRDLAQERSQALATLEEEESYIHRLLQTVDFCSRVILLPVKGIMKDATNDFNRLNKTGEIYDRMTDAICHGPYMSQLKNVMKTVTEQAGATPELDRMEEKIKHTIQENSNEIQEAYCILE